MKGPLPYRFQEVEIYHKFADGCALASGDYQTSKAFQVLGQPHFYRVHTLNACKDLDVLLKVTLEG
jgi:hypothetical protein